jgi:hypothetical protein
MAHSARSPCGGGEGLGRDRLRADLMAGPRVFGRPIPGLLTRLPRATGLRPPSPPVGPAPGYMPSTARRSEPNADGFHIHGETRRYQSTATAAIGTAEAVLAAVTTAIILMMVAAAVLTATSVGTLVLDAESNAAVQTT